MKLTFALLSCLGLATALKIEHLQKNQHKQGGLTQAEKDNFYAEVDANGDGFVDPAELVKYFKISSSSLGQSEQDQLQLNSDYFLCIFDEDEDGKINKDEFFANGQRIQNDQECFDYSNLKATFRKIDANRSDNIDPEQLKAYFLSQPNLDNQTPSQQQIQQMINKIFQESDSDQDRQFNFDQFSNFFTVQTKVFHNPPAPQEHMEIAEPIKNRLIHFRKALLDHK